MLVVKKGEIMYKEYKMETSRPTRENPDNKDVIGTVRVSGDSSHRIIFSKIKKGTRLILEAAEDGEPIVGIRSANADGSSHWESSLVDLDQIRKIASGSEITTVKSGLLNEMVLSLHSTATSRQIGERPAYLNLTANTDGAKLTIGSHVVGNILALFADEMPMLVRRGGFLVGQQGIVIDRYTVVGPDAKLISQILGNNAYFQEISGEGLYFLEILGDCPDEPYDLYPGEVFIVEPSRLVAMTKSVQIIGVSRISDKQNVRIAEGTDYNLILKANALGGKVIVADLPQRRRHRK